MKETRTIEWTTGSGVEIKITMVAQHGLTRQAIRKTSGRLELSITTTVNGESLGGMARLSAISHSQAVAKISNGRTAVGLTQEQLDKYTAAKSELEAIIDEHNAPWLAHESELDAIDDDARRIEATA